MKAICLPRRNWSSFWAFCSSRLTFVLKWEFWMIVFRAEAIFVEYFKKCGKFLPEADRRDFNSSSESTTSTSLTHNIASDWKSEQVVNWFLNRIYQTKNDCGLGNLSNCSSDICGLRCPHKEFFGNSTGVNELMVDGRLAKVGIGIVPLFLRVISWEKGPCPCWLLNWSSFSLWCTKVNSLMMICGWIKRRKLITKTFSCNPSVLHVSRGWRLSRLGMARELGIIAGWLET